MKDSMKMTVGYQFCYMLLMQTVASGVTVVFGLIAFWYFLSVNVAKEALSVIFMIINFAALYMTSKKFAKLDNKSYTPLKPNKIKGVLFGVFIALVTMILTVMFKIIWIKFSNETGLTGVIPIIINAVFYYWTFPFNGILGLNDGRFMWYAVPIMAALPIAATVCGYTAGCRNFDISEKINKFVYEKE